MIYSGPIQSFSKGSSPCFKFNQQKSPCNPPWVHLCVGIRSKGRFGGIVIKPGNPAMPVQVVWEQSCFVSCSWPPSAQGHRSTGRGNHSEFQYIFSSVQFSSVQSLSRVQLFSTPWIAARQASLSITNSRSSPRLTSIESVMPSSHLILCRPLFLLPPIPPSIRVFSNESTLHMRWPKYWSFSFSIIPSKEHKSILEIE